MLSALLDVGIGLVLVFLVLSIAVSAASELINNVLQRRAKDLEHFVVSLLANSQVTPQNFYQNTALTANMQNNRRPAYIQATDFVDALFTSLHSQNQTLIGGGQLQDLNVDQLRTVIAKMDDSSPLKKVLSSALAKPTDPAAKAIDDMARVRAALEAWYDNSMDRVSGWFKQHTQYLILAIGLILSLAFNVDTIAIANNLLRSPALRSAIAARASTTGQIPGGSHTGRNTPGLSAALPAPNPIQTFLTNLQVQLDGLDMPIGWPDPGLATADLSWWLKKIIGILITGFAVSQGAPFWFDMLNRITNLRGAGSPPDKATPLASPPAAPPPTSIVVTAPGSVMTTPNGGVSGRLPGHRQGTQQKQRQGMAPTATLPDEGEDLFGMCQCLFLTVFIMRKPARTTWPTPRSC